MTAAQLPFVPIRKSLYTADELFSHFDPGDPRSWAATTDFAIYSYFVSEGGSAPSHPYAGMMQALHDNSITQCTADLVRDKRVVAIMGGHKMSRASAAYADVARLARRLTANGSFICSGGGPGAMEASHLGAAYGASSDAEFTAALTTLATSPEVPNFKDIVDRNGQPDRALVEQAHRWFLPAHEVHRRVGHGSASLAVPTWHYGHEPSTPFASHIAKYFQNSIREDGLLALGSHGVVFAEGKAGTIQEIFQDAAQNYYRSFKHFSPMVLLGEKYWMHTFPVAPVLQALFGADDFKRYVLVTDDIAKAAAFIEGFNP